MPPTDSPPSPSEPQPPVVPDQKEETSTQPKARPRWVRRSLWVLGGLLPVGLVLTLWVWPRSKPTPDEPPSQTAQAEKAQPQTPAPPQPRSDSVPEVGNLDQGDNWVRLGNWEKALAAYHSLVPDAAVTPPAHLQLRLALCYEGMGNLDQALATYRAAASQTPPSRLLAAIQVGQARIWLHRRQPADAQALLSSLLLRTAQPELKNQPVVTEANCLLALGLAQEVWPAESTGVSLEDVVNPTTVDWAVERTLDWITPAPQLNPPAPAPGTNTLTVKRLDARPEESLVTGTVAAARVADLVEELLVQGGFTVRWTPKAKEQTADRTAAVNLANVPLLDVIQYLAGPRKLVWNIADGVVQFSAAEEIEPKEYAVFRVANAQRALRAAIIAAPDHPLRPQLYVELGNLEMRNGHFAEAGAWYEQSFRERQRSALGVEANYNLGLALHRLGNAAAARHAWYRVLDQAPAHQLTPLAYVAIGRTHLEEGEAATAITPLRRAVTVAQGSPNHAAAVLHLAAAYLLAGQPRSANAVLVADRQGIGQPPYRAAATFLDALARFRVAGRSRDISRNEGTDLLIALLNLPEDPGLGKAGPLLVGKAYRDLGLVDRMVPIYEKALRTTRGPLAEEMALALAEAEFLAGKRETAQRRLITLAMLKGCKLAPTAQYRLAEIALLEKRPKDCLLWCRQFLSEQPTGDATALLQLMGRAFEMEGDFAAAARCFGGQRPG